MPILYNFLFSIYESYVDNKSERQINDDKLRGI